RALPIEVRQVFNALVAQWIERSVAVRKGAGSIPAVRTILLRSTTENHSSSFEESVLFKDGGSMGGGPVSPKQVGFWKDAKEDVPFFFASLKKPSSSYKEMGFRIDSSKQIE